MKQCACFPPGAGEGTLQRVVCKEVFTISANHFARFSEEKNSIRRGYIKIQTLRPKKHSKNQTTPADKETKYQHV